MVEPMEESFELSFLLAILFFARKPKVVEVVTDLQNVFTPWDLPIG